jgi:hypothetical protein
MHMAAAYPVYTVDWRDSYRLDTDMHTPPGVAPSLAGVGYGRQGRVNRWQAYFSAFCIPCNSFVPVLCFLLSLFGAALTDDLAYGLTPP